MRNIAQRTRRSIFFIFLVAMGYLLHSMIDSAPKFFVALGEFYDCGNGTFYNGEECVKNNISMASSPPCGSGYQEVNNLCIWSGRD